MDFCYRHGEERVAFAYWRGLHCPECVRERKRAQKRKLTLEQRQAARAREAARKGKPYTPGVKPWKAKRAKPDARSGHVVERKWRALECSNARDAWDYFVDNLATADWLRARDEFIENRERRKNRLGNGYDERLREGWRRHAANRRKRGETKRSLGHIRYHEHLREQHTVCQYCEVELTDCVDYGRDTSNATIDHIIAQTRGGSDLDINKAVVCLSCNASKGDLLPDQWLTKTDSDAARRCAELAKVRALSYDHSHSANCHAVGA
jgi:hypothetical protein